MPTEAKPPTLFERLLQTLSSTEQSSPVDKDSLITLLREAQQRGLYKPDTLTMLEGALQVADQHVRDIMIPRAQVVSLGIDDKPENMLKIIVDSGHSRFPVIGDNRDDVQGIFLAKDLLSYFASGEEHFNMRELMRPAVFIPESKRLNVLLRDFRSSRNHMAIVVDEYSGIAGLVTIEDVLEQIVGNIDDEHDIDDQVFIKQRDDGFHSVLALTPIEEFNEHFDVSFSDEEFDTIGGLLLQAFGHMPKRGEELELAGFHFEVVRSNSRRIHLLRVQKTENAA